MYLFLSVHALLFVTVHALLLVTVHALLLVLLPCILCHCPCPVVYLPVCALFVSVQALLFHLWLSEDRQTFSQVLALQTLVSRELDYIHGMHPCPQDLLFKP